MTMHTNSLLYLQKRVINAMTSLPLTFAFEDMTKNPLFIYDNKIDDLSKWKIISLENSFFYHSFFFANTDNTKHMFFQHCHHHLL